MSEVEKMNSSSVAESADQPCGLTETQHSAGVVHAADCQSHIVDVRGRPDECTCGADAGQEAAKAPIDMVLHCPACGLQHIDEFRNGVWENPPHRSHLCYGCGCIWRPADVPTNGVAAVATRGKADTFPAEMSASSPAEGRAGNPATDELLQSQARRVKELALDVIALAEHCGELANLSDGPCLAEGLCGEYACEQVGCIKDKADRARSALSEGSGSSRELAPPDESGDACGATERAEG